MVNYCLDTNAVIALIRQDASITAKTVILNVDRAIAREYGRVQNELRLKGRPIPTNDVWIAATARIHDLTLLTRDAHFGYVDRLRLEGW